jgi:hypothetical protein
MAEEKESHQTKRRIGRVGRRSFAGFSGMMMGGHSHQVQAIQMMKASST